MLRDKERGGSRELVVDRRIGEAVGIKASLSHKIQAPLFLSAK